MVLVAEEILSVISDAQLAPWFGKVYDLILTDRRFIFVYVRKTRLRDGSCMTTCGRKYSHTSAESVAERPGAFSVPYDSIRRIQMKGMCGRDGGIHYLCIHYEERNEKGRRLKVLIRGAAEMKGPPFRGAFRDNTLATLRQDAAQLEYAIAVKHELERALPLSVLDGAVWNLTAGCFKYAHDYTNGIGMRCPICDAGFGRTGSGLKDHLIRTHSSFYRRAVYATIMIGITVVAIITSLAILVSRWLLPDILVGDALVFITLFYVFVCSVFGIVVAAWWYRRTEEKMRHEWSTLHVLSDR